MGTSSHSSCLSVLLCPLTHVFTPGMCVGAESRSTLILLLLLLFPLSGFVNGRLCHMEIPLYESSCFSLPVSHAVSSKFVILPELHQPV